MVTTVCTCRVKSKRGAELGIASLVSAADISTANNTISIIMAGPLAKNIADEYDVDPRKSASILDIFGGCFQGYSHIVLKLFQQLVLLVFLHSYLFLIVSIHFIRICGLVAIILRVPRLKDKPQKNIN